MFTRKPFCFYVNINDSGVPALGSFLYCEVWLLYSFRNCSSSCCWFAGCSHLWLINPFCKNLPLIEVSFEGEGKAFQAEVRQGAQATKSEVTTAEGSELKKQGRRVRVCVAGETSRAVWPLQHSGVTASKYFSGVCALGQSGLTYACVVRWQFSSVLGSFLSCPQVSIGILRFLYITIGFAHGIYRYLSGIYEVSIRYL